MKTLPTCKGMQAVCRSVNINTKKVFNIENLQRFLENQCSIQGDTIFLLSE